MARPFWERYLDVFDVVNIVSRAMLVERVPDDWQQVNGTNVLFRALPDFQGPWQFLKRYPAVRAAIHSVAPDRGAVILRVGSQIANLMENALGENARPFGLEVGGDPWAVLAPGVLDHPLRPFFRWHFSRRLRRQCQRAAGVSYVTKRSLQERYPSKSVSFSVSDVELPPEAFVSQEAAVASLACRIPVHDQPGAYRLVTVGAMEQLYKGADVLIEAVARCVQGGLDLTAVVVGDGRYRPALMAQAERAGVGARIEFTGQIAAGEPVRRILDSADLFIMPSRTEGLPRALLEAMARGLPCIGSAVGGIPELLEPGDLVPADDSGVLAARIRDVVRDPARKAAMSVRNIRVARGYSSATLDERRRSFLRHIRDLTKVWEMSLT